MDPLANAGLVIQALGVLHDEGVGQGDLPDHLGGGDHVHLN